MGFLFVIICPIRYIASSSQVLVAQPCLTLCSPMDYSPPGFSVLGILQARILEWVAIPFFRESSQPWRILYYLNHQGSQDILQNIFKDLFVRTSNTCSCEIIPLRIIMKLVLSILFSLIHQFWQRCSVSISNIIDRRGEVLFQANSSFPNTLLSFKFRYLRKHPAMWEVL